MARALAKIGLIYWIRVVFFRVHYPLPNHSYWSKRTSSCQFFSRPLYASSCSLFNGFINTHTHPSGDYCITNHYSPPSAVYPITLLRMDSPGQDLNNEQSGNPQQRVRRASDICVEELAHRFQFWRDHGETTPIADSLAAASRSRQRPDSSRPTAERTATPHVAELESQLEQIQLQLQTNEERRGRVRAELEMHADQHRRKG
jgi:hypothetical protein